MQEQLAKDEAARLAQEKAEQEAPAAGIVIFYASHRCSYS